MNKGQKVGIGAGVGGVLVALGIVAGSYNSGYIGSLDFQPTTNSTASNAGPVDTNSPILSVSVTPEKDSIVRGSEQTIYVKVSDENDKPVQGAPLIATVAYASGSVKNFSGESGSSGNWQFTWQIEPNSNAGIFRVQVTTKGLSEIQLSSGTAHTSFMVTEAPKG